jgi:hypothetical protein
MPDSTPMTLDGFVEHAAKHLAIAKEVYYEPDHLKAHLRAARKSINAACQRAGVEPEQEN